MVIIMIISRLIGKKSLKLSNRLIKKNIKLLNIKRTNFNELLRNLKKFTAKVKVVVKL